MGRITSFAISNQDIITLAILTIVALSMFLKLPQEVVHSLLGFLGIKYGVEVAAKRIKR